MGRVYVGMSIWFYEKGWIKLEDMIEGGVSLWCI